jgi:hypothetical protein
MHEERTPPLALADYERAALRRDFGHRGSQTKVVLIDGSARLDLMLRHHVGLRVERRIEVLEIDQNYFSDEDQHGIHGHTSRHPQIRRARDRCPCVIVQSLSLGNLPISGPSCRG